MGEVPRLIAEREGLFAVDKPSGWVAHATRTEEEHDVLAWAEAAGLPAGLAPVHRLDRGTSGVLLYAATPELRAHFGGLFAAGRVDKEYLALVFGRTHRKGVIRRALHEGRAPKRALTRWRRVEALGGFTLILLRPETGRKHQIRKHLHGIGHPVVGDERYRPPRFRPVPAFPKRLWLHGGALTLPGGLRFESPLPLSLQAHLAALRRGIREGGR